MTGLAGFSTHGENALDAPERPRREALHLAICANHGATLYTLDQRLGEAGALLGVQSAFF
jgi:predicted nucleic acid-binding protein